MSPDPSVQVNVKPVTEAMFCHNPLCGLGTYVPDRQGRLVCGFCGVSRKQAARQQ